MRLRFVGFAGFVAGIVVLAASGGCVKNDASLGEACLTSEDCFSGYCAQQICVSGPPLLDAQAKGDAPADAVVESAAGDATADSTADGAATDAPRDGVSDAVPEGSADVVSDVGASDVSASDVSTSDGSAAPDASADVRLDVAEGG
jgi:hypothetical protein